MAFGELLRRHRLAAGIAQETLAERARLSVETISALERGARQKPYLDTISLLAEALGLSPEDRAELERAASRRSARPDGPTNNLPAQISSFIGREHDVAKVGQILSAYRLLTLAGPGGVGKTRLALRVAAELTEAKRDGVWFIDLSAISNASRIASAIATGIGLLQNSTLDPLIDFLRTKRLLLILDNCEHLIDSVALTVDAILRACPNITILATSREPLSTEGEHVYRVPPLERDDAIELFAERAEAADSRFELTDSVKQVVTDICELLDGIALAIELAAVRTAVVPLETVAAELHEHLQSSAGRRRTPIGRQQTMETLFDWSYGLLDEREKRVFRALSVFVGGFSQELAVAICSGRKISEPAVTGALESLVAKSLVQCEILATVARYRMLEPVRQYAREKLRECAEEQAAARAHALALLALAEGFDSSLDMTPDLVWDALVRPERENFRAAVEWSVSKHGSAEIAQRLVGSMTAMWYGVMSGEAQQRLIESALASCSATTPQHVRAKLELAAARSATEFAADAQAALDTAERALRSQPAGDARGAASAQYLVGLGLSRCGRIAEAEAMFREALATACSVGAQYTIAAATASLGAARMSAGDLNEARALVREALQLHRQAGCERLAAATSGHLAEIEFADGRTEAALELSREVSDFYREERDWWLLALILTNQSAYSVALGRYDQARSDAREGLVLANRIGLRRIVSWAVQHLAAVAGFRGRTPADRRNILRAGLLLGFVDEQYSRAGAMREGTEQQEYEKLLVVLREAVGERKLVELMAEGALWTEDRAVAEALEI